MLVWCRDFAVPKRLETFIGDFASLAYDPSRHLAHKSTHLTRPYSLTTKIAAGCSLDLLSVGGNNCLDLGAVCGVGNKEGKVGLHVLLRQVVHAIELFPELFLERLGRLVIELNSVEAHSGEDAHSCLEASIILQVLHLAVAGHDVNVEGRAAVETDESVESLSIGAANTLSVDHLGELQSKGVLTVVLPDASEVGLVRDLSWNFVGENQVLLFDKLWGQLAKSIPLGLEGSATLRGGGVNTEVDVFILVGVCEGVKSAVLLGLVVRGGEQVTAMSPPGLETIELGHLVVEEATSESATVLLETEPLEDVRLLTLTDEGSGSPFGAHILHGVIPGLSGVGIPLGKALLLCVGPVWNLEALENGTGLSVEAHVTNTLEQGVRVEVLSVNMVHDVGLLVEFVLIQILNTHAYNNKLKSSRV